MSFRFTKEELSRLMRGEIVKKDGNEFWIKKKER